MEFENESGPSRMSHMTPPSDRDAFADDEAPQSRWPTVIGVIAIVLASFGLVCGCSGYFGPGIAGWFIDMQTQRGQTPDAYTLANLQAQRNLYLLTVIVTSASLIVAGLEMAGAIALVRRRPSARMLMMGYAIAALVMACVGIGYQIMISAETERMAAGQDAQLPAAFKAMGLIIGLTFTMVLGFGWPIFLLVWFSRRKIRDEVDQWREGARV